MSLAVKYRPKSFEDVTGQNYTVRILEEQIKRKKINNAYLFCGASGCGKALANETPVLAKSGWKPIGSVKVGDKVYSFDGTLYNVLGVYPQGVVDTYRLYFRDGTTIDCSGDHLWVYRGASQRITSTSYVCKTTLQMIEDLQKYKSLMIDNCNPIVYDNTRPLRIDALINGFLFRFLQIDTETNEYYFSYTAEIKEDDKIANMLRAQHIIMYRKEEYPARYYIKDKTNSGVITKFIQMHKKNKPFERKLEKSIIYSSIQNRISFLKGFFYIKTSQKLKRLSFTTSNLNLMENIKEMVGSLGGSLTYYKATESEYNDTCVYRAYIQFNSNIYNKLGIEVEETKGSKSALCHKLYKIEKIESKECTCIEVDSPDKLYITKNFIATHNTTVARIFANEINQHKGVPIERDVASNNGVESAREIISDAHYQSLDSEYKVYILDEAHSATNAFWQAMLKTIEEPPAKSIFIFCTTEVHKIPNTILNRVQRFDFTRMNMKQLTSRLKTILKNEKILDRVDDEAIHYIAQISHGGMRDAITNLDKCLSYEEKITLEKASKILSMVDYDILFDYYFSGVGPKDRLKIINDIFLQGNDLKIFINQYVIFLVNLSKYLLFGECEIPNYYFEDEKKGKRLTGKDQDMFEDSIKQELKDYLQLKSDIMYENNPKNMIEAFIIGNV